MLFEKTLSFVEKCFRPWWCFKALYYCGESWKLQTWLSWGANITGHKLRDLFFIWKKGGKYYRTCLFKNLNSGVYFLSEKRGQILPDMSTAMLDWKYQTHSIRRRSNLTSANQITHIGVRGMWSLLCAVRLHHSNTINKHTVPWFRVET